MTKKRSGSGSVAASPRNLAGVAGARGSSLRINTSLSSSPPRAAAVAGARALGRSGSFSSGSSSLAASPVAPALGSGAGSTPYPFSVRVALLSKNLRSRAAEFRGAKGEVFALGELYLNDLSDLRVFELANTTARAVQLQLRLELRKPFQASQWGFQLENENLALLLDDARRAGDAQAPDEFNHVPFSVLRPSSKAALCAENVYLCEGYNELFNHIDAVDHVTLAPHETARVVFALCAKLSPQHSGLGGSAGGHAAASAASAAYALSNADSSEEERMHLNETSCAMFTARLVVKPRLLGKAASLEQMMDARASAVLAPDLVLPLQGQVCRSLLRLDVKELHFDDCVPGGSFVKDFTVWNRSEIPLLFKLVSSLSTFDDTRDLITCTDYNSGYAIGEKTLQAAAYGHVRIRVTYRPREIGERFFDIQAQNLHDARNVKTLKIHAITNKEHHREGLSIKEPSGSYLMSGSKLDFGDCYTGIANSKVLLIRNTTEATLHVDLTSDRPKEISFELKLQQNRARASRAPRSEEVLSPTGSNDGSSQKDPLSPDAAKAAMGFSNVDGANSYGMDSDDEGEENEMDFFEDEFQPPKRSSFDENPLGDLDDIDDDFEFDRESRAVTRSPPASPKTRAGRHAESRKKPFRTKAKKVSKVPSRVRDLAYESGVESSGNSLCSSPERKPRPDPRKRQPASIDEATGSNFLVETIDLPPGMERTILIWYTPAASSSSESASFSDNVDGMDLKGSRLTKQTFRVSFRCFQVQGAWQQAQSRVYDRTLGKAIHIRARTCTSLVTLTPSVLHLGDCNIGELKSSSCMLTNHSELPTVVKPLVTSKVISTVPNDEMTLGPKQSTELKIEIIPRKTNPNYSRLISILNLKNRTNVPQICVRSSNMDAHHVIYHSLFYKLLTQSRSAFLNFDHITLNSVGIQVFDLENITNAPLQLSLQSSDPSKVRLYCFKTSFGGDVGPKVAAVAKLDENHKRASAAQLSLQPFGAKQPGGHHGRAPSKVIRRRRSFGSLSELENAASSSTKRNMSTALRGYLSKKAAAANAALASAGVAPSPSPLESTKLRAEQLLTSSHSSLPLASSPSVRHFQSVSHEISATGQSGVGLGYSSAKHPVAEELAALLNLFDKSRAECDRYCHSTVPSAEKEQEIVGLVRERMRKLQSLLADKKLLPLTSNKDRTIRIPAKSQQRVVVIFSPSADFGAPSETGSKMRVEKQKIFLTLPPGGNKKAVADAARFDQTKATWVTSKHPFDSRPSVRELLLKSRVCRSVMNVNQKNINFGRIATSSKSSKRLVVQNMSPIPLVYSVEKTGSISSGFLEIKEGEVGVVKAFGTNEICFEFQPTLAGPFEEKLRIVNVQDVENSISVTIKAKVVKRETFKLLQSGQVLSLGKCLVGEKSEEIKIGVRNTSRKKREYVIQLDPGFSNPSLRPTFHFSIDETPSAIITQAQEKKLDEELEKLEHKLRIATTKKKSDKITKLNAKISRVKALLSGEQVPTETTKSAAGGGDTDDEPKVAALTDVYDSCNSESEMSESEAAPRPRRRPLQLAKSLSLSETRGNANQLHFSLDAEATCRIVAHAVFTLEPPASGLKGGGGQHLVASQLAAFKSQKARKRQLRRDSAPIIGVGKFLLFEQQNKDIVKELQFSAEVFLRTDAGEAAYSRVMGRTVTPHGSNNGRGGSQLHSTESSEWIRGARHASEPPSPLHSQLAKLESERGLSIAIPESDRGLESGKIMVKVEPSQFAISRSSTLLVPLEESPVDTYGWDVTLSHQSPVLKKVSDVEVAWHPTEPLRSLLQITCDVTPLDAVIPGESASKTDGESAAENATSVLPLRVRLAGDRAVTLRFKWCFAPEAGFAPSSSLASCISRSVLAKISRAVEQSAGTLAFVYRGNSSPSSESSGAKAPFASIDVTIVKAVQRSLAVDADKIELGEQQQNTEVQGEFIIRNRSHRQVNAAIAPSGGDLAFEKPNGTIAANSHVVARFTYRGVVPGQHSEQIQLRNLNDRLDTSVLTVAVRVTRPVYVRIPELDPHETGRLEVLDVGPCYVTPEMQDAAVDSPNVSLKFSKVHKLTLQNQVDETLVLCASSNLKTQCYVFEDARLNREATGVVLKGNRSVDLYVAFRPRLSGDAFKTGSTRDLVGGIRVQLFRLPSDPPGATGSEDDRSEMAAEFTVKFVGVAGASLARVTPMHLDFGVEHNWGGRGAAVVHAGRFELINISKALPLHYRLIVASDNESYSDDDSLRVALEHDQGEVAPGDTRAVAFTLTTFKSGFFRRRILVENLHYPGKISFVDVQLFVDSGALKCEVFGSRAAESGAGDREHGHAIDFGVVNVIRLEDALSDARSVVGGGGGADAESVSRKYRIFETRHGESNDVAGALGSPLPRRPLARERFLTLTNTTDEEMVVRPVSTLPLDFVWCECGKIPPLLHECQHQAGGLMARSTSVENVRRLLAGSADSTSPGRAQAMYIGDAHRIPAQSSSALLFRFAPISLTAPLSSDLIETGRLCAFSGVVAIQRFESVAESGTEVASTLKLVNVSGQYGEPIIRVAEKRVLLGKIGYAIGWKSSSFELSVRNACDVAVCFAVARLPACLRIRRVRGATQTAIVGDASLGVGSSSSSSSHEVPSLRELALLAENKLVEEGGGGCAAWRVDAMGTCVLEMEFFRTAETFSAGVHDFPLRFLNLYNPHNVEDVLVRAHIISSYAELTVDPEKSSFGSEPPTRDRELFKHTAFLPPVVVPPSQDSSPHGANFWFSLRNVYDEELSVKLSSTSHSALESTLEFLLFSRSANTPVSTLQIAPGDSVDVRVVCHVFSSARLSPDTLQSTEFDPMYDILELGSVWLDVSVLHASEIAQTKHIKVKGKLVPGRTFTLSASSLHFFASATEVPADIPLEHLPPSLRSKAGNSRESVQLALTGAAPASASIVHHLRNASETFYVRNPSATQPLNIAIEPVAMYQAGLCLLKGVSAAEMSAMSEYIEAVAVPSSGTIAPGDSLKVTVRLEEATAIVAAEALHFHGNGDNAKAASLLHKMRHHPSWRSNSWGVESPETVAEAEAQNHMFLKIRDVDVSADMGTSTEVGVHLVLQQNASSAMAAGDGSKPAGGALDTTLIVAAFVAREKRLAASKKMFLAPSLSTHVEDTSVEDGDFGGVDNLDEFDVDSIGAQDGDRRNQLPVLTVRGCTPAENSTLESTRYIVDAGQHTVRNGGEVEWEITIECLYNQVSAQDGGGLDPVDYKLILVDRNAKSWLQLSRDRGTLDRSRSYQSVVLYFLRDVVGVYSTFMVLQNVSNPSDLKVIHVRLEVIADLNMLRSMSSGADPATNLFRVLVSNHSHPKRSRRASLEALHGSESLRTGGGGGRAAGLVIDYSDVYYHKLYHNHSIVLENSSGLALDFMLSSNARPQEVSFSTSPTSFTEVSAVTLEAHGRMQVFLHFRPQPRPVSAAVPAPPAVDAGVDHWVREIEVYINCRLVKDFRETVLLRAVCSPPQLQVSVAQSKTDEVLSTLAPETAADVFASSRQSSFLGAVFAMPEAALSNPELAAALAPELDKFIVVRNTRSDVKARLALRNDSMFFTIGVDVLLTAPGSVDVHYLDSGICAGRRSTLLVTLQPRAAVVFRVTPDITSLWRHHQLWDHTVKEHATLYNIKQFAEHSQVTLCFTCSNTTSFYIPPNVSESYPFSALEDTIAKFLQNYNYTWRGLVLQHDAMAHASEAKSGAASAAPPTAAKLAEMLSDFESALELASPLSPRKLNPALPPDFESSAAKRFDGFASGAGAAGAAGDAGRDGMHQLLQAYRALYFDFYYITDELVWYGVRGNAVRHSLMLADLAYGVVFNHEVFRAFVGAPANGGGGSDAPPAVDAPAFPRLLLPWVRQLGHFLSYFPESQETTLPLRQLYDQLRRFE
ncbi:hypothetical protein PybrP1_012711 [[Pythium] brassicae (nom. inval.)]|nr:hypothetical protein PybrP1_012711 [[Pythium] brassicae (nom. inval.)]